MTEIDIDALDGVELGRAVAVEVMGWPVETGVLREAAVYPCIGVSGPHSMFKMLRVAYSPDDITDWQPWSDLRAAGEVLDKMTRDGYGYSVYGGSDDTGTVVHSVSFWHDDEKIRVVSDWLPSRPTAICRAALKAVRGEREG